MIFDYISKVKANGCFDRRRNSQAKYWMYESINEQLHNRFYNARGIADMLAECEKELLSGRITSFAAATKMLDLYDSIVEK